MTYHVADVVAHHAQVGHDLAEVKQDGSSEDHDEDDAGERADLDTARTLVGYTLQTRAYLLLRCNSRNM